MSNESSGSTKKARLTKTRTVITYTDFWDTSHWLFKEGVDNEEGCFHRFMASQMFTAFTLEAFLNHVGEKLFSSWDELERLSVKGKLAVICEKLCIPPQYGQMPWRIVPELIGFRNKVAHGRTTILSEEGTIHVDDNYDEMVYAILKAPWEEFATRANVERARDNVFQIMEMIFEAAEIEGDFLLNTGMQLGSASIIDGSQTH